MARISKLICSVALMLVMVVFCGVIGAFAMTPEEEAADAEYTKWLENVKIVHHGTQKSEAGEIDVDAYAKESIELTNQHRSEAGIHELSVDDDLMELAAIRAKELASLYSHERPDGTHVTEEFFYAEMINRGTKTPTDAVNSWMASTKGHKELMLREKYNSIGAGCYKTDDGTVYWVQLFSK